MYQKYYNLIIFIQLLHSCRMFAKKNKVMTTPYYTYDLELLDLTLYEVNNEIKKSNFHVHYAVKANYNTELLKKIKEAGLGADCVSGREINWALDAGFCPNKIVFAGVGKTDEEIIFAIKNDIGMIHCEGLQEAITVNEIAIMLDEHVDVALRLNPNLSAATHSKITTGLKENKFGFSIIELNKLIAIKDSLTRLNIKGLHFHIGSQIIDLNVFKVLCQKINDYVDFFEANINNLTYLNVGGGLGIDYNKPDENLIPDFKAYFEVFKNGINRKDIDVHFELGRSIVGQCGKLLTKVLYVKESETKQFAIVDAGMTELLRPALYDAYHQIDYNGISFRENDRVYDVVGPICESSDCLGTNVMLPQLQRGDILTVKSCGAYAESMSLNYNGREKIKSVFV